MRVFLGLGSNIEPEKHLDITLHKLVATFGDLDLSQFYRTAAIGFDGQSFINMAAGFETAFSVQEVTDFCQKIEREVGRRRESEIPGGSRCIDIDLLLFESVSSDDDLPEPRSDIREFAYAAVPLAELIPDWRHELTGDQPLAEYIQNERFASQQIVVVED